jgi:hypothetical protein
MKIRRSLFSLACLALTLPALRATTVIPPTFDQLVNQAELIFQGTVTDLRPQWMGEGAERHIVTFVTFKIDDPIKGALNESYTIRMFGGTLDGQTMEATDTPRFKLGDRDILFVENNGTQFVPLVGIMHGRFRIQKEASGRENVSKDNGAPVSDLAKLGLDEKAAATGPVLATAEFKAAIRQKLGQNAAK